MAAKTDVTNRQGELVAKMAREKGIQRSAFQSALTDGRISKFLDTLVSPIATKAREWATWMTATVGQYVSVDEYRKALADAGFKISDWGNDILGRVNFRKEAKPTSVEFVRVSVAKLGFSEGAYRRDIYKKALELGLTLCEPEDGLALRFAYKDQPVGEWILVAMEPITDSDGYPSVFRLVRDDDGTWLDASRGGRPDRFWHGSYVWVFRRNKS